VTDNLTAVQRLRELKAKREKQRREMEEEEGIITGESEEERFDRLMEDERAWTKLT